MSESLPDILNKSEIEWYELADILNGLIDNHDKFIQVYHWIQDLPSAWEMEDELFPYLSEKAIINIKSII